MIKRKPGESGWGVGVKKDVAKTRNASKRISLHCNGCESGHCLGLEWGNDAMDPGRSDTFFTGRLLCDCACDCDTEYVLDWICCTAEQQGCNAFITIFLNWHESGMTCGLWLCQIAVEVEVYWIGAPRKRFAMHNQTSQLTWMWHGTCGLWRCLPAIRLLFK